MKKHLISSHKNEFTIIIEKYPDRNFYDIHKYLRKNKNEFKFLNFKISASTKTTETSNSFKDEFKDNIIDFNNVDKNYSAYCKLLNVYILNRLVDKFNKLYTTFDKILSEFISDNIYFQSQIQSMLKNHIFNQLDVKKFIDSFNVKVIFNYRRFEKI